MVFVGGVTVFGPVYYKFYVNIHLSIIVYLSVTGHYPSPLSGVVSLGSSFPSSPGFNPTFGPSWINLYGSPQNSALGDIHQFLNEGLSEGIFYRGRMLLSLSVEVYSSPNNAAVENSKATAGARSALGKLSLKKKSRKSKENKQEGSKQLLYKLQWLLYFGLQCMLLVDLCNVVLWYSAVPSVKG